MAFLEALFRPKQDPLNEKADTLVSAAQIHAAGSFTPLLDRFQFLGGVNPEAWNFFVTVGTVFMGVSRLNNLRIGEAREDRLKVIVAGRLNEWNKDGIRGFEDCKRLFESEFDRLTQAGHDSQFVAPDSVGKWIAWNILERAPQSDDECLFVRAVGAMVTHVVFDWWRT